MMFLLPLLAAVVYVLGALLLKRAVELGAGTWRIAFACNVTAALVFAPLALLGGNIPSWQLLWQPALVAMLFVVGQFFTFESLQVGDVSIATPVLGLKIIFVALLTTVLLRDHLSTPIWIAAVLSSVAVGLLNFTSVAHRRVGLTVLLASAAAAAYAFFDVLVQRWSPSWGAGRFLPIMMAFVGVLSLPLLLLDRSSPVPAAQKWLIGGALCLGTQSVMFVSGLALFGHATRANVLYSTRGIWSVVAVWVVGHWFRSSEQHLGRRVLMWRLIGAALLMSAIVLVVLSRAKP
jgi:drug/metabolite transporter (DMT)-like permease